MNFTNKTGLGTLAVHAGQEPDPVTGARAVPLYQTTSFIFNSVEEAANIFALKTPGNIYTRLGNPTTEVFEKRIAAIEGGSSALALSSGAAAIFYAVLNLTGPGDEIVSANNLYGGTYQMFHYTLPKLGRQAVFVDSQSPDQFKRALTERTRAIYVETIGNPRLDTPDFEVIAGIAHEAGIPLIVDNTIGVGLVRPFDYGADLLATSATKYIGGHGTSLAGVIVEKGDFPWNNGKFPEFTEPDEGYHGLVYWDLAGNGGKSGTAFTTKIRSSLLRDTGACLSPFNAWLLLQGLETLHLRQERHSANAMAVAQWLKTHPLVSWVNYPGLPDSPYHGVSSKYLKKGFGGMIGFGVKGGREASARFIDHVQLLSHLANIGDAKTLVIHPGSTTHQQLSDEELESVGITPDFIRLSVGIEDVEDIIADMDQALHAAAQ